jgi:hypothetical protein
MNKTDSTLTQEYVKELFDYVDGALYWKQSRARVAKGDKAGSKKANFYIYIQINKKFYLAHRLIFLWHHGYLPKFIDHKDVNPSNNKIENLREATQSQNLINRKKFSSNKTGFKGVRIRKNRFVTSLGKDNKQIHIGTFKTAEEAHEAYKKAAIAHFGEFAKV